MKIMNGINGFMTTKIELSALSVVMLPGGIMKFNDYNKVEKLLKTRWSLRDGMNINESSYALGDIPVDSLENDIISSCKEELFKHGVPFKFKHWKGRIKSE